jgi:hypothetical protein
LDQLDDERVPVLDIKNLNIPNSTVAEVIAEFIRKHPELKEFRFSNVTGEANVDKLFVS